MATLVYVVDTTALLAKWVLMVPSTVYTVPQVIAEARDQESRQATETAIELGRLRVLEPPPAAVKEARDAAHQLGLHLSLSETDIAVAALALHLAGKNNDVVMVTDDYALQNLATSLGLRFMPLRTRGIREKRSYTVKCPACGFTSSEPGLRLCPRCGTPLRRYIRRRSRATK